MKYIITRSSNSREKPIKNCIPFQVHFLDRRYYGIEKQPNNWEMFISRNHDIHRDNDGYWCGTNNEPSNCWVAEITDILKFAKEFGQIIVSPPDNAEGLWNIEIYDDYRE